jgi:hypothetical protein
MKLIRISLCLNRVDDAKDALSALNVSSVTATEFVQGRKNHSRLVRSARRIAASQGSPDDHVRYA